MSCVLFFSPLKVSRLEHRLAPVSEKDPNCDPALFVACVSMFGGKVSPSDTFLFYKPFCLGDETLPGPPSV